MNSTIFRRNENVCSTFSSTFSSNDNISISSNVIINNNVCIKNGTRNNNDSGSNTNNTYTTNTDTTNDNTYPTVGMLMSRVLILFPCSIICLRLRLLMPVPSSNSVATGWQHVTLSVRFDRYVRLWRLHLPDCRGTLS